VEFKTDFLYVILLFALFVVPRILQRFGIPGALTSVALGAAAGMGLGLFQGDATAHLLASFGIVSLFLFAGLDVSLDELRREWRVLSLHLAIRAAALAATMAVGMACGLDPRVSALVSLALLTPSTGFILDNLSSLDLDERQRFWVKSKAIATELLALGVLFAVLQSTSAPRFVLSSFILLAMVALLPLLFRFFAAWIAPYAPRSEFAFLLMTAIVCAFVTRELGVYYLVGAFVVGMAAERFRERLPALASEELVRAVEFFASFFVPFYFFDAGLQLVPENFTLAALGLGLGLLILIVPVRLFVVGLHRRLALGEPVRVGLRIAVPMLPTLVFGLVISSILRDRFAAPAWLVGGIVVYTIATTILPSLILRRPPMELERPTAPHITVPGITTAPIEG
jgi:Kef-type K+ transport system membrane component KefB